MQPWQQGVIEFQADLAKRCDRLVTFMMTQDYLDLPDGHRNQLAIQLVLMRQLNDVLVERTKAFK